MKVILELSDLVVMRKNPQFLVYFIKKHFGNWKPIVKTLIEYNSKNRRKMMKEEKEPIDIELT